MTTSETQFWTSASSAAEDTQTALDAVTSRVLDELDGRVPHVLFVFVSAEHSNLFSTVSDSLNEKFPASLVFGCSAGGVIGGGEELDTEAGLSLCAAYTPGIDWSPVYVRNGLGKGEKCTDESLFEIFGDDVAEAAGVILLPDSFTVDPGPFLEGLNLLAPGLPVVGGMAAGGRNPGDNALFFADRVLDRGMIGLVIRGPVVVETIVAQGCRPIGSPLFVTSSSGNVLHQLDGRPALEVLRELFHKLPRRDQDRFRAGLLLGVSMLEGAESYQMGDFVMRNVLGIDPETEQLGISAPLEPFQVVQFHVRDGHAASDDLREMLRAYNDEALGDLPQGVLLFSCVGRGSGMFGVPNHDSAMFSEVVGEIPIGGFFGNGEIGPVHGRAYLHGFSSSFALFREPENEQSGGHDR